MNVHLERVKPVSPERLKEAERFDAAEKKAEEHARLILEQFYKAEGGKCWCLLNKIKENLIPELTDLYIKIDELETKRGNHKGEKMQSPLNQYIPANKIEN
ncbi:hypothetical protein ACFLS9_07820 [Bacteroidota bacterium]